jgi:hypothetical protein
MLRQPGYLRNEQIIDMLHHRHRRRTKQVTCDLVLVAFSSFEIALGTLETLPGNNPIQAPCQLGSLIYAGHFSSRFNRLPNIHRPHNAGYFVAGLRL